VPQTVDELAKALMKVIENDDLRLELSKKVKEKFLKEYTIDVVFNMYQSVWEDLIKSK
jgi:glycosyltransferase involved in cell wall biosynthesis